MTITASQEGTERIERDSQIRFHEEGTLLAVTRWISSHDEGIAEWLKNANSAYQPDRAAVHEDHQAALLLLCDQGPSTESRIGLLDVGGATLEDVTAWSTWQDLEASSRGATNEEGNQGNGGKAYMFRLFRGATRILGVKAGKRNVKGFAGHADSVERGTPGFIPTAAAGREVPVSSWKAELESALAPYGVKFDDLPAEMKVAIKNRQAFTLVEGVEPLGFYKGRIDGEELIRRVLRHDQSTLAVQQLRLYATHNGRPLNSGRPLELEVVPPYPGLEGPFVHAVPHELPLPSGELVSTTESGTREAGRLILFTSRENMPNAYKNLRPRWRVTYRTSKQMVGSKPVSELAPAIAGAAFVFATVELPSLEPAYVEHGRRRPKDGPLMEALDYFVSERIRELAKQINDRRRKDLDERVLDEVHQENQRLDDFKNKYIVGEGEGGEGGSSGEGAGGQPPDTGGWSYTYGKVPETLALTVPAGGVHIGRGLSINLPELLETRAKDSSGRTVPHVVVRWTSSKNHVASIDANGRLTARAKGQTDVVARIAGTSIESQVVPVEVWSVDHVLLTPRVLDVPLGVRRQIVAEVTDDEGRRSTSVMLQWKHDADDQLVVRIGPRGLVTGNRLGRTAVSAGAGNPADGSVWARTPVEVTVIPNPEQTERGGGFPRLLLTEKDIDPATNEKRPGNPDAPALWQEFSDYRNNIWWLNLLSPEAAYAFGQHKNDPRLWRHFHVQKVMDMVAEVFMQEEYTKRGNDERPGYWADHRDALEAHTVRVVSQMWSELESYVEGGGELG